LIEVFIRKFKLTNVTTAVNINKNNPLIIPQFLNNALGKAKAPAPKAQAIKAKMLALKDPGFRGPKYLVQQFFSNETKK
jgi:hypothetical protein